MLLPILRTHAALLLAERPGDLPGWTPTVEALCRHGLPPFVVVLTDDARPDDAAVRAGVAEAGLNTDRLLMFGIGGALPTMGAVFEAAVNAICFVAWRQDCNLLGLPDTASPALLSLARAAVGRSGLGLTGWEYGRPCLLSAPRRSARDVEPVSGADQAGVATPPPVAG